MSNNQSLENDEVRQESESQPQEKLLSQSEVNMIVGREKQQAADKARRDAEQAHLKQLQELKNQVELQNITAQSNTQSQNNENHSRELDAESIYQQVQERFNQEMQQSQIESQMSQVANNYLAKMGQGKERYEDFHDITKDFDPTSFPNLVFLVSGMENAADIIYDLSKNPSKLAMIDRLSEKSPNLAKSELLKLGSSISENQKAMKNEQGAGVNEPLDRMQPSRISSSNGKMSIRDLQSQDYLRG